MTATYLTATSCKCETPQPVERAERKGAAVTECARCGLPVPLRLGR
jgi:hypothetical protein